MGRNAMEELLDRYLKGEALPAEIEKIENWLNAYHHSSSEWEGMDSAHRDEWLSDLYKEIETDAGIHSAKVIKMRPRRTLWRSIAAVAAVLAVCFIVYLKWPVVQNQAHLMQLTSLKVPQGQKTQITLADGSKIWINEMSELKYPKVFDGKTREVYLSGEAYFDIRHDASHPFIIHTGKVITTVLGTAFNIKEDKLLHTIVVSVTRGRVSVANGIHPLGIITPNQQITYNEVSEQYARDYNVNAEKVTAWQQSYIHFDDVTFADAAAQLQLRFKVKISFANQKVKNCRFTGTALSDDKLDRILKVICTFNNAGYKTNADGSIIIDGPGCE
jgi:ferric-dicitrate binding protein FerR (iron transport regulator)